MADDSDFMILGCVWCPNEQVQTVHRRIREIKKQNGINPKGEIKWSKVSKKNSEVYRDVVNFFFDVSDLNFRAIVINKRELEHQKFCQTHDEWYYKMLFRLINVLLDSDNRYRIFLDYKDTQSGMRSRKLHEVLCNSKFDFDRKIVTNVQCLPSNEIGLIQLCDILIGAVGYSIRGLNSNEGKIEIVDMIKRKSRKSLEFSTLPSERKFNLFFWHGGNFYD